MHGGLSTGPKTVEGRARLAQYARERARAQRESGDKGKVNIADKKVNVAQGSS